jgi:hypothetical protein
MSKNKEDRLYQSLSRTHTEAGKKVIEFIDLNICKTSFSKFNTSIHKLLVFARVLDESILFVCLLFFLHVFVYYITDLEHLNMFYILVLKLNLTLTDINYSAIILFYFSFVILKFLFQLFNLTFVRIYRKLNEL